MSGSETIVHGHMSRIASRRHLIGACRVHGEVGAGAEMRTRRHFTAEFKARVALEAIRGDRNLAELAAAHQLHPNLIMAWRRHAIEEMAKVFDRKVRSNDPKSDSKAKIAKLHAKIGQLVVERDALASACQGRTS
jgi:transposase